MIEIATITMKEFRDNIGDDEAMLQFAADHIDASDDAMVQIEIHGSLVKYGMEVAE